MHSLPTHSTTHHRRIWNYSRTLLVMVSTASTVITIKAQDEKEEQWVYQVRRRPSPTTLLIDRGLHLLGDRDETHHLRQGGVSVGIFETNPYVKVMMYSSLPTHSIRCYKHHHRRIWNYRRLRLLLQKLLNNFYSSSSNNSLFYNSKRSKSNTFDNNSKP